MAPDPSDTTILVTHGPPHGTLDLVARGERVGSTALSDRVEKLSHLDLHVFGHVHEGRGVATRAGRMFANVSLLDAAYQPYPLSVPVFEL